MKSHEVLKSAFENTSPKNIAAELGVSLSLVYKWAQEQSDTRHQIRQPQSARPHHRDL
jgi:transposase